MSLLDQASKILTDDNLQILKEFATNNENIAVEYYDLHECIEIFDKNLPPEEDRVQYAQIYICDESNTLKVNLCLDDDNIVTIDVDGQHFDNILKIVGIFINKK